MTGCGLDADVTIIRRVAGAAAQARGHVLLLRLPGEAPRHIPLGAMPLAIGRTVANDVVLPTPEISRRHCVVSVRDDVALLTDLGSTNGTFVDGREIAGEVALTPGARIGVGQFVLHYVCGAAEELVAAEAHEKELARATFYIQGLLPPPLTDGRVQVGWRFAPSAELGGDGFGYRWLDATRFALYLLDVAGHGLGSALLAVSVMNVLRSGSLRTADPADPVAVLEALNAAFPMEAHGELFFPIWYGVYDTVARRLSFACGGHHPGYLIRSAEQPPLPLAAQGRAIGMHASPRCVVGHADVPPNSLLVLFSDGAFEITDRRGRDWRLGDLLPLLPAAATADQLFEAIRAATGVHSFQDDVSVLTVRFT